jgi:hypothetical protein
VGATGVSVGHAKWQEGTASYQGQARGMDMPAPNALTCQASTTTPTGRGDRPPKVLTASRRLCCNLTSTGRRRCVPRAVLEGVLASFTQTLTAGRGGYPLLGSFRKLQVVTTRSCGPGKSPGMAWASSTPRLPPLLASAPACYGAGDGETVGAARARQRFPTEHGVRGT